MTEIVLKENDRISIIFRKLIDLGGKNIIIQLQDHLKYLNEEQQKVFVVVLAEGGEDSSEKETVLFREFYARDWESLADKVKYEDSSIDLDKATFEDPWAFEGFDKIYEELPEQEWLVAGKIQKPGLVMIYGPPKSFKSGLIMDLSVCVAAGLPWLPGVEGEGGYKTQQTPVVWCDFENGLRRMRERFSAFGRARNLPIETPLWFVSMPIPILEANIPAQIGNLIRRVNFHNAGVIVIDHFGATLGSADENNSSMAEIMANYRILSEATQATVLLIHHQTKHAKNYGGWTGDTLRGHGSILANLDLAVLVKRDDVSKDKLSINPVAIRGADWDSLGGMWTFTHKPGGYELQEAKFMGWTVEDTNTQVENAIIKIVGKNPGLNQTALRTFVCDMTGIGDNSVRKRISYLDKMGKIISRDGPQKSKLYDLP